MIQHRKNVNKKLIVLPPTLTTIITPTLTIKIPPRRNYRI